MIYLLTSDGHRESIDLGQYATTEQELIQLVQKHFDEIYWDIKLIDHKVDFLKEQIVSTYLEYGKLETIITPFLTIDKI